MEKKTCFIIMPFSKAVVKNDKLNEATLTYLYNDFIKKAVSEYKKDDTTVFDDVSRFSSKVGSIVSGIVEKLNAADLVIADLTGLNSNVMYELGVRHTLKRGTIIITQDISTLPSDLRDYLCIQYEYPVKSVDYNRCYEKFKADLHKAIDEVFDTTRYDSPVLNYLEGKAKYWNEDEKQVLKSNIVVFNYILEHYKKIQSLIEKTEKDENAVSYLIYRSLINNILDGMRDLKINIETSILYEDLQAAQSTLSDLLQSLSVSEGYDQIFGAVSKEVSEIFNPQRTPILNFQVINYFALNEEKIETISLKKIFSDEGDFNENFLEPIDDYFEEKAKEIGISDEEIEFILSN
ncbi:MAG: hypothetical protein JST26_09630 [Bacteroidetes bacterium]|nr:hypothetical protein [Bacteroidota bacterium]